MQETTRWFFFAFLFPFLCAFFSPGDVDRLHPQTLGKHSEGEGEEAMGILARLFGRSGGADPSTPRRPDVVLAPPGQRYGSSAAARSEGPAVVAPTTDHLSLSTYESDETTADLDSVHVEVTPRNAAVCRFSPAAAPDLSTNGRTRRRRSYGEYPGTCPRTASRGRPARSVAQRRALAPPSKRPSEEDSTAGLPATYETSDFVIHTPEGAEELVAAPPVRTATGQRLDFGDKLWNAVRGWLLLVEQVRWLQARFIPEVRKLERNVRWYRQWSVVLGGINNVLVVASPILFTVAHAFMLARSADNGAEDRAQDVLFWFVQVMNVLLIGTHTFAKRADTVYVRQKQLREDVIREAWSMVQFTGAYARFTKYSRTFRRPVRCHSAAFRLFADMVEAYFQRHVHAELRRHAGRQRQRHGGHGRGGGAGRATHLGVFAALRPTTVDGGMAVSPPASPGNPLTGPPQGPPAAAVATTCGRSLQYPGVPSPATQVRGPARALGAEEGRGLTGGDDTESDSRRSFNTEHNEDDEDADFETASTTGSEATLGHLETLSSGTALRVVPGTTTTAEGRRRPRVQSEP